MKTLKIISVISFLLICSIDPKGFPAFMMVLISLVAFVQSLTYSNLGISWDAGLIGISVIGMLIFFLKSKSYKDRYFLLICFLGLLVSAVIFTGILNPDHYYKRPGLLWFFIPFSVFIISSSLAVVKNFKRIE